MIIELLLDHQRQRRIGSYLSLPQFSEPREVVVLFLVVLLDDDGVAGVPASTPL